MLLISASCWLLDVLGSSEELLQERSGAIEAQEEKQLIEALQEVLEKLKSKQLPRPSEKKLGWVPEASSAPRCGCPGGAVCDCSVLRCL